MLGALPWIIVAGALFQATPYVREGTQPLVLVLVAGGLSLVQCVLATAVMQRCVDAYLGTRPVPVAGLAVLAALLLAVLGLMSVLFATNGVDAEGVPALVLFATAWPFAVTYGLVVRPLVAALSFGAYALLAASSLVWAGVGPASVIATFLVLAVATASAVFTTRSSAWYISVLRELDAAQGTRARLAVAEERLRFARDLHDVMGRNLSAIALKSELATQLATRGGEAGAVAAAEQMDEVQQLARASQTEIRAVVRGYRDPGLRTELAGARGILRAAGVDCRVEGYGGDGPGEGAGRGAVEVPGPVQAALGWVVREGATNVLMHADASYCTVRVDVDPSGGASRGGTARLTMENDGVRGRDGSGSGKPGPGATGRLTGRTGKGGSGLAGLRERIGSLGGTLTVATGTDGTGPAPGTEVFRLTAEVPLDVPGGQDASTAPDAVEPAEKTQ
ncbi:hypothetical protein HCC30_14755 [Streptomyces sp. HNM0574]|nr:hypothetical protein [Streptomyces sp. HNM0574]